MNYKNSFHLLFHYVLHLMHKFSPNSSPKTLPRKSPIFPKLHSSQSNFLRPSIQSHSHSKNPKLHFTASPVSVSSTSSSFPSPVLTKKPSPSVIHSRKPDFLPLFVQSPVSSPSHILSLTPSSVSSSFDQVWQFSIRILNK